MYRGNDHIRSIIRTGDNISGYIRKYNAVWNCNDHHGNYYWESAAIMSVVTTMIHRGDYAERIQKIYEYVKKKKNDKTFTYQELSKKFPSFHQAYLKSMRESNVIKLLNGKSRVTATDKKHPTVWVFTSEALFVLEQSSR